MIAGEVSYVIFVENRMYLRQEEKLLVSAGNNALYLRVTPA